MMLLQTEAGGVDTKQWESHSAKLSGILIPGFGSSRLLAWSMLDCPYSPMDFHPLDPVWLDIRKVGGCQWSDSSLHLFMTKHP